MKRFISQVAEAETLIPGIIRLRVIEPELVKDAKAGQFVHINCGGRTLMRRPISICNTDAEKGSIDIVFEVRGEGTKELALTKPGDMLDMLAPLGNGFDLKNASKSITVVGGGIGIFPLLFVLSQSGAARKTAILGFRSDSRIVLEKEFAEVCDNLIIMTEDGSRGQKGMVSMPLERIISENPPELVCACGPAAMMKAVARLSGQGGARCLVSMEERMGCGVGACLVCACAVKHGEDFRYAHVCKDGPVFDSLDIAWEGHK